MSRERGMTRNELIHLLERAHAIDEARLTDAACQLADADVALAGSTVAGVSAATGTPATPRGATRVWLGSPIRFRRVIHSDATLEPEARVRLLTLLEELGGIRPPDAAVEVARETDDGVHVEIRPDRHGTRIEVISDRRPEAFGAAAGIMSLSFVCGVVVAKAMGSLGTPGLVGVAAVCAFGGCLGIRLHLAAAAVRWQVRLDAVSAAAGALVRRASVSPGAHTVAD